MVDAIVWWPGAMGHLGMPARFFRTLELPSKSGTATWSINAHPRADVRDPIKQLTTAGTSLIGQAMTSD